MTDPFQLMTSALMTGAPLHTAMPHRQGRVLDDAQTEQARRRFEDVGTLPFPAGAVALSQRGGAAALAALDMPLARRAATALLALSTLWPAGIGGADDDGGEGSAAVGLARHGIGDWLASWGPQITLDQTGAHQPAVEGLLSLALDWQPFAEQHRIGPARLEAAADTLLQRIDDQIRKDADKHKIWAKHHAARQERDVVAAAQHRPHRDTAHAFANIAALSTTQQDGAPAAKALLGQRLKPTPAQRLAVREALARPLGEWNLLAALFIKLLQGRLAYVYSPLGVRAEAHGVLFPAVVALLDDTACQPGHPLATVAAGVGRVLAMVANGKVTALLPAGQPACFDCNTLHANDGMLSQARKLLTDPQLAPEAQTHGQFTCGAWVDEVGVLADEVAAALTDPVLAQARGLGEQDFLALAKHVEGWKNPKAAQRLAARAEDADHRRLNLLPKLDRLYRYHHFMGRYGVRAYASAQAQLAKAGIAIPETETPARAVNGGLGRTAP